MARAEVARLAGISRVYLQQLIAGDKTPSVDVALRLAATLGKPVDTLFQLIDAATPHFQHLRQRHTATLHSQIGTKD